MTTRPHASAIVLATLFTLAACWAILSNPLPIASAQDSDPQAHWEYKAVRFNLHVLSEQTDTLNELASQGWEYVGVIAHEPTTSVAFRRQRQ